MSFRPRRSVLYMPGSNARAHREGADLAGRRRDPRPGGSRWRPTPRRPRAAAGHRRREGPAASAAREVFIRINGIETPWHADDLAAAARGGPRRDPHSERSAASSSWSDRPADHATCTRRTRRGSGP